MNATRPIAVQLSLISLLLLAGAKLTPAAHAQTYLDRLGGPGGGEFTEVCNTDQNLAGFDLRSGDDVDAIRPVCRTFYGPTDASPLAAIVPMESSGWHGGNGGGKMDQLVCPSDKPVVIGLRVYSEGRATQVVSSIWLYCGQAVRGTQAIDLHPSAGFEGPVINGGGFVRVSDETEQCPAGQVAIGVHGRSGTWVDAIGLMCGPPKLGVRPGSPLPTASSGAPPQKTVVGSMGRVPVPGANPPICARARAARARNSGAAANLEQQCRLAGGDPSHVPDEAASAAPPAAAPPPPDDDTLNGLQQRGRVLAQADPLLQQIYQNEPDGPNRLGFETGLASNENDTGQGPNKERFKNQLPSGVSKAAFQRAIDYTVDRNANQVVFLQGQAVVAANPGVMAARQALPLGNQWLGFTIAAGLFGNPADGGMGRTQRGPTSNHIREMLSPASRLGYDAALSYLGIP